jgi:hypothetical protein
VLVEVFVGGTGVLVLVAVFVAVLVAVFVAVLVAVLVAVFVAVLVGVLVAVFVGVLVAVLVAVFVDVLVGTGVFVEVLVGGTAVLVGVLVVALGSKTVKVQLVKRAWFCIRSPRADEISVSLMRGAGGENSQLICAVPTCDAQTPTLPNRNIGWF